MQVIDDKNFMVINVKLLNWVLLDIIFLFNILITFNINNVAKMLTHLIDKNKNIKVDSCNIEF